MARSSGASMTLHEVLESRWSCRAFLERPVPRAVIDEILLLAQRSPSWCNTQPWGVHITEGAGTERFRRDLGAHAAEAEPAPDLPFPEAYEGEYLERRRACGWQLYDSAGVRRGDREASRAEAARNFALFGAPHVAVITTERRLGVYGAIDCGLYVHAFLLAAQSLGVGTVAQAAIAAHGPFVRRHLGLEDERLVVCGISFGYPDLDDPRNVFRTARAEPAGVVSWHER